MLEYRPHQEVPFLLYKSGLILEKIRYFSVDFKPLMVSLHLIRTKNTIKQGCDKQYIPRKYKFDIKMAARIWIFAWSRNLKYTIGAQPGFLQQGGSPRCLGIVSLVFVFLCCVVLSCVVLCCVVGWWFTLAALCFSLTHTPRLPLSFFPPSLCLSQA